MFKDNQGLREINKNKMAELEELQDDEMGEILEYDEDELEEEEEEESNEEEFDLLLETSTHDLPVLSPLSKDETSMSCTEPNSNPTMHELTQRSHKLERERRDLLDQLASLKETSLYTEHNLANDVSVQVMELTNKHCKEIEHLKREFQQVKLEKDSTEAENTYLKMRLEILEEEKELISEELERCQDMLQSKVKSLQEKTIECDDNSTKLAKSDRKVQHLERKLREGEEDRKLATVSKQQLMAYQELEQSHRHLNEENKLLRERVDNVDLLTYQLQSMREKVSQLESEQETYQQLQAENQILKEKLDVFVVGESPGNTSPLMSPSLMRLQLIHLQHKEVILTTECSELKTQVKISENTLQRTRNESVELKEQIQKLKTELEHKLELIQKWERRVKFITKERDGVVNVLHSYKLDGGADSILKEHVTELEASNSRLNEKILEQAKELECCYASLERTKIIQEES